MQYNSSRPIKNLLIKISRLLPSVFWLLLIFAFDTPAAAIGTLLCAAVHECGHLLALSTLKRNRHISASMAGMRISDFGVLSYKQELFVASAGPIVNILIALLCLALRNYGSGYFLLLGILNLLTAFSNLLPIKSYDGAKILSSGLSLLFCEQVSHSVINIISFAISVTLSLFSLYLISRFDAGYFIFFVFFIYFVKNIRKSERK